jgi:antitoxin ParD1/3/4
MAQHTQIALGDHFEKFVGEQIDTGRYDSVSEVVREALSLLEERESRLEALRAALIKGEQGTPVNFDVDTFLARKRAERAQ